MSLTAGTVTGYTLDARGNASFSGAAGSMSLALAQARAAAALVGAKLPATNPVPTVGQATSPYSKAAPATQGLVDQTTTQVRALYDSVVLMANADAAAIVSNITGHAKAVVSTQQLGVMPSSTSAGTPIDHPASPVEVPIS